MQELVPQRLACYDELETAVAGPYHGKKSLGLGILHAILPALYPSPASCHRLQSPFYNEHPDFYSLSCGILLCIGSFFYSVTHFAN